MPPPVQTGVILVVDDEASIQRFLAPALAAAGYTPLAATTGAEALRLAATAAPDLILLDLGLPDCDGHAVLARLRAFSVAPVIVVSARDREADKIAALDGGANDYVEKPFALGELLARIRNLLRLATRNEAAGDPLTAGPLVLDPLARSARLAEHPLALTRREFALLALLVRNRGRVLTQRQILTAVWGPAHDEDVAYLRIYVSQLRRKLAAVPALRIVTESGIGYRLIAE